MIPERQLRDQLRELVPWWLSDRKYTTGQTVGFRFLWVLVALLDAFIDYAVQGLLAALPGLGTYTALPYIGRSRGIIRGRLDTDASYAAKLTKWLDKWASAGASHQLAIELQEYLGTSPRIRVFNRHGQVVTLDPDGTLTRDTCAWDWDSVSHPARAGYWSELFVVIYGDPFTVTRSTIGVGTTIGAKRGLGLNHACTRIENAAARGVFAQWKSAHSKIRVAIWCSDDDLFDPDDAGSLPNGEWGAWGTTGDAARVPSDRNYTDCLYWEF
jgi:hypothetical protein